MNSIPTQTELTWPVIRALRALGGSGSVEEIDSQVIEDESINEEAQSITHNGGPRTEVQYRLAWARTYLKNPGLVVNSRRGVWALTDLGWQASEDDTSTLISAWRAGNLEKALQKFIRQSDGVTGGINSANDPAIRTDQTPQVGPVLDDEPDWKAELLDILLQIEPYDFEKLARRLLREEGFVDADVTQRSRDGGIDGVGTFRISLISFRVFFQCKRYRGSVRASDVRDFRGAMAGRGDKGLLITTGSFTSDAKQEAVRPGATPIELIDGDRLCDLLRECELGVTTETKTIEVVRIDPEFFETAFDGTYLAF